MNLVERAKNILLTPKTEWAVIEAEPTQPKDLYLTYIVPLAALSAVMVFVSLFVIASLISFFGAHGIGFVWALVEAIWGFIRTLIAVGVMAFIVDALAPTFGGTKSFNQALKVVAYSGTAAWVGSL